MLGQVTATEDKSQPFAPITLNAIFDAYLKDRNDPYSDKPCKHPGALADHLKPLRALWGDLTIAEFSLGSKKRVELQVKEWRGAGGWSLGTCRKRIATFKAALSFAFGDELIDRIPTFKMPPPGPPRERVLTKEEIVAITKAADDPATAPHIYLCWHLSIRTAQRQSAIRDLTWDLVDFENRVIRFRDTETAAERSKKRRTNMPISDSLCAILQQAKSNAETQWVLEWQGRRVRSTYAGMMALYARAGVKNVHRHDIRRTAATLAYQASGDMNMVANLLGDTPEMAARHYAHATHEDRRAPVDLIGDFVDAARKAG